MWGQRTKNSGVVRHHHFNGLKTRRNRETQKCLSVCLSVSVNFSVSLSHPLSLYSVSLSLPLCASLPLFRTPRLSLFLPLKFDSGVPWSVTEKTSRHHLLGRLPMWAAQPAWCLHPSFSVCSVDPRNNPKGENLATRMGKRPTMKVGLASLPLTRFCPALLCPSQSVPLALPTYILQTSIPADIACFKSIQSLSASCSPRRCITETSQSLSIPEDNIPDVPTVST